MQFTIKQNCFYLGRMTALNISRFIVTIIQVRTSYAAVTRERICLAFLTSNFREMVQTDFWVIHCAVVKTSELLFSFLSAMAHLWELIWVVVSLVNLFCPQPISKKTLSNWEEISKFSLDKISNFGVNSCHLLWQRNAWHIQAPCLFRRLLSGFIGSALCLALK